MSDDETEKLLKETEEQVRQVYQQASDEATARLVKFMEDFTVDDAKMKQQLAYGIIDQDEYDSWYREQMVQSYQYQAVKDAIAVELVNADLIAAGLVNGNLPEVYAVNINQAQFDVCKELGYDFDPSFVLYDKFTVQGLLLDGNRLFPTADVDVSADTQWIQQKLTNSVTMGIIQGESIENIAKRMEGVANMSYNSAIRTARTLTTSAQNAGRVDSYAYAQSLGINVEQEWLATLDDKTRSGHRHLDGVRVPVGSRFPNGLRYPGDPTGAPAEVYNCRCTLIPYLPDFAEDTNVERWDKLPDNYSYEDWKKNKAPYEIVKKDTTNLPKYENEMSEKGYVGLSGDESDKFIDKYHNPTIIGRREGNTMDGLTSRRINGALRNGEMPTDPSDLVLIDRLDAAINSNELPMDMTLFRGVPLSAFDKTGVFSNLELKSASVDDYKNEDGNIDYATWEEAQKKAEKINRRNTLDCAENLIGMVIKDDGYMQVSASSERNLFGFSAINLQIHAPSGTNAYISDYKEESEIILARGTSIRIVDAEYSVYVAQNGAFQYQLQLIAEIYKEDGN